MSLRKRIEKHLVDIHTETFSKNDKTVIFAEYHYNRDNIGFHELNEIRRALFQQIPSVAISSIRVTSNTTFLQEEEILNALAYVLIRHDKCKMGTKPEQCTVTFDLNVEGPHLVMSNDLKLSSPNKDVMIIGGDYPLFNVDVGTLNLTATVKMGTGLDHAAFFPVTVVYAGITENAYTLTIESTGSRDVLTMYKEALSVV